SPGTDMTFFDWGHVPPARAGAGTISETAFRVRGGRESLQHWVKWFTHRGVAHRPINDDKGAPSIAFHDPEGQCLRLVSERAERDPAQFHPWRGSPVPLDAAIVGLAAVSLTLSDVPAMAHFLTETLDFRASARDQELLETGDGGAGAQLRLQHDSARGAQGA